MSSVQPTTQRGCLDVRAFFTILERLTNFVVARVATLDMRLSLAIEAHMWLHDITSRLNISNWASNEFKNNLAFFSGYRKLSGKAIQTVP
eukprot:2785756-Amphidinium_carterae.1